VLEYGTAGATRGPRPPGPPVLRLLAIGLVLLPLTVALGYPVACLLPWGWEAQAIVDVTTTLPGKYGPTANFHIVAGGTGRGSRARMTWAAIRFGGLQRPRPMHVDLVSMRYGRDYGPWKHPLTRDAVRDYVLEAGFGPGSGEASSVTDTLTGELRKLAEGRLPPDMTGRPYPWPVPSMSRSMTGTHLINIGEFGYLLWWPWYGPYCLPFWAAAWWWAGRPLIRRYRFNLAEYDRDGRPQ
jgi:hypothetical protein